MGERFYGVQALRFAAATAVVAVPALGHRLVLRPELCNGCWLCFANCPEGAITIKPDGKPAIYYPHCKGCLDCVEVCPTDAMTVERETEAAKQG